MSVFYNKTFNDWLFLHVLSTNGFLTRVFFNRWFLIQIYIYILVFPSYNKHFYGVYWLVQVFLATGLSMITCFGDYF